MNYQNTLEYFGSLETIGIKLGLENIRKLLFFSGSPEENLRFVHIAGTNGKGSTACFIAEMLKTAGYKAGLYTSPHLERVEERFQINGVCISQKRLAALATYYKELIDKEEKFSPTYFEVTTAIAIKYFSEEKADMCVMEVGMGGRLDATNVIRPDVCVITSISPDHKQYLGKRLSDIAEEKFSIIKPNVAVVAYLSQKRLRERLKEICKKGNNPLRLAGEDINYRLLKSSLDGQVFTLLEMSCMYKHKSRFLTGAKKNTAFKIRLLGSHQLTNASLAFGAIDILSMEGFDIDLKHIREGFEHARWPGRFEIFKKRPYIVIDGAHNPDAMKKLKEAIGFYFPGRKIILILGTMVDKEWPAIVKMIAPIAKTVLACSIKTERACPSKNIAREAKKFVNNVIDCKSLENAVHKAVDKAVEEDVICVTGSLYLIGEAKKFFKEYKKT